MKRPTRKKARPVTIRKARMGDVEPIHKLVTEFARKEIMLPRSRSDLYESLRDFEVADLGGKVVGCGALTIEWDNLAEVKSVAVSRPYQRRGIGRRLVKACMAEAQRLGITRVFALTMAPTFFESLGFQQVPRESLPHKVWSDCLNCTKFPDCDELPMAIDLPKKSKATS
jgi:amino-acid N-acetyltransferase